MTKQQIDEQTNLLDKIDEISKLVVFNDDSVSFDTVIEAFCEILHYDSMRAEQLALNIHNTGKAIVKTDLYEMLVPIYEQLSQKQITAEIQ